MRDRKFDPYAPPSVLVADDEPEMVAFISDALEMTGYRVAGFTEGTALFKHLLGVLAGNQELPQAVVADVRMPHMSGLEVLAGIASSGLHIPVVLITAFGDAELHARARALGAASVLDKPFDISLLKSAVAAARRAS